jgi:site-specific DNA-adenine methylase
MHFYFSYFGNKRSEIKHLSFDYKAFDTIVEPFCGSCAFSFHLFNELGLKDKRYIMADNDKMLIDFLNDVKLHGSKKYFDFVNAILVKPDFDKEMHNSLVANKDKDLLHRFNFRKAYNFQLGLFPSRNVNKPFIRTKQHQLFDEFAKHCEFVHQDFEQTMSGYADKPECLIFLDPPYLNSCNLTYSVHEADNTHYYVRILSFLEGQAKMVMILNSNAMMEFVFGKYIKSSFDKTYKTTHKKVKHLVIANDKRLPVA